MTAKVYIKTVVTRVEGARIDAAADEHKVTRAEYMRNVLTGRQLEMQESRMAEQLKRAHEELVTQQREAAAKLATLVMRSLEPVLHEVLLLTRELASERNAQTVARVAAQVRAKYPTAANGGRHE